MQASFQPAFEYRLDPHDALAWVSDEWLAFARENGARQLGTKSVIGKSLWDFIPDEPTRQLYRDVFSTVRATDQAVVLPFRCDSPTLRRFMRLEVRHRIGCGLDLRSVLVRVEPCERCPLLDANVPLSNNCVTMCSCCKFIFVEPEGWEPIDEATRHPCLVRDEKRPHIRYEVCAACQSRSIGQRLAAIDARLATVADDSVPHRNERERLVNERSSLTGLVQQLSGESAPPVARPH